MDAFVEFEAAGVHFGQRRRRQRGLEHALHGHPRLVVPAPDLVAAHVQDAEVEKSRPRPRRQGGKAAVEQPSVEGPRLERAWPSARAARQAAGEAGEKEAADNIHDFWANLLTTTARGA